jgi:hypothetical protein
MSNALRIFRGDTRLITVPVTLKSTGAVFNLTGYAVTLTVKKNLSLADSAAIIQKKASVTNPALGVITMQLTKDDTNKEPGNYKYDVEIENATTGDVQTVVCDDFIILADVSRNIVTP